MRDVSAPGLPACAELARNGSVRSRDVQDLLGTGSVRASQLLSRAAEQGYITLGEGATGRGRGTYYVPTDL